MTIKGIADFVSQAAPLLGSVITSSNPLAGVAISLIANLFNADPKNIDDIMNKMSTDSQSAYKLKQLELDHQELLEKNQLDDKMNARDREVQIVKVTGKHDIVLSCIAAVVIIGYFIMCLIVAFTKLDQSDHDVLYMMIGQLTAGFIMVLGYYFGASNISTRYQQGESYERLQGL